MKSISNNQWKKISDEAYIAGLKKGDTLVVESFFYGLCNYLIHDIKYSLMGGCVDEDELVSELFLYLSKDDWHKLDTFAGINGCSLCSWVTRIAWRHFFKLREQWMGRAMVDIDEAQLGDITYTLADEITMDVQTVFDRMPNKRYVKVLQWMFVEGWDAGEVAAQLHTTTANVYNIKHRAIVQFIDLYDECL